VAIIHRTVRWCTGLSGEPTVACACPVRQSAQRSNGRICQIWKEIKHRTVYRTCPVRHKTEGKDSLPCWSSTTPSCLGAIKGTPRHMEESPKHSLSILKHPDSTPMHLILCVSDLSSIWVANSVCCTSSSSCDLCAWLCFGFESCVCCSPLPYFCASFVIIIVRARGSKLWRFLANRRKTKEESRGIQVDHWITWKGLSATLIHWDATTWK
jgi:hypothetical protein